MNPILEIFQEKEVFRNILATLILLLVVIGIRQIAVRSIREWNISSPELRRRWLIQSRNFSFILFVVGLVIIWATELRSLALSIAALAVAIVIATKELLLCFIGSLMKASTNSFKLGDRIEVAGFRGDVIDQHFFGTTLLEVGPGSSGHQYTGRRLVIPNSLFMSSPVINEAFGEKYAMHTFRFSCSRQEPWRVWEKLLLEAAQEECAVFIPEAQKSMNRLARDKAIDTPSVEPRLTLDFSDERRVDLIVRVPCPPSSKGRVEQAILRRFLSKIKT